MCNIFQLQEQFCTTLQIDCKAKVKLARFVSVMLQGKVMFIVISSPVVNLITALRS